MRLSNIRWILHNWTNLISYQNFNSNRYSDLLVSRPQYLIYDCMIFSHLTSFFRKHGCITKRALDTSSSTNFGPPSSLLKNAFLTSSVLLAFHSRLGAVVHDHPYVEALFQQASVLVVADKVYGCETWFVDSRSSLLKNAFLTSSVLLAFHSRLGAVVHDHPYVEALFQQSCVLVVADKVYGCESWFVESVGFLFSFFLSSWCLKGLLCMVLSLDGAIVALVQRFGAGGWPHYYRSGTCLCSWHWATVNDCRFVKTPVFFTMWSIYHFGSPFFCPLNRLRYRWLAVGASYMWLSMVSDVRHCLSSHTSTMSSGHNLLDFPQFSLPAAGTRRLTRTQRMGFRFRKWIISLSFLLQARLPL